MPGEIEIEGAALSPARLRRWRRIREAAILLFAQRGFVDVSVEDISAAAGVSRRTFFNYFPTKNAVLFLPDPEESPRLTALLGASPAEQDLWSALRQALLDLLAAQESTVAARRVILRADPDLDPQHMLANAAFERAIITWLGESGVAQERAHLVSSLALAVVRSSFQTWPPESGYGVFLEHVSDGFDLVDLRVPRE
jgi:AcrR family transcriptional regulator